MPIDLKKYLAEAEEQLRPALETRIGRLAKEQREEQLYGAEKLQQAGRFTSGFRTSWMERVMDIYTGYKEQARGETGEKALSLAQFLSQLAQQAEQTEMDRLMRERELAQQATLTREGYALQRALATLGGGGVAGGGVSAPTYRAPTRDTSLDAYNAAKDAYEGKATAYGVGGYPPSAAIFNIPSPEIKRQTSPYAYRYTPTLPSKRPTQTTQQKRRGGEIY